MKFEIERDYTQKHLKLQCCSKATLTYRERSPDDKIHKRGRLREKGRKWPCRSSFPYNKPYFLAGKRCISFRDKSTTIPDSNVIKTFLPFVGPYLTFVHLKQ